MAIKNTESTNTTNTTTIRIEKSIKEELENLDFVRKNTFNEILSTLIEFYNKNKKGAKNEK